MENKTAMLINTRQRPTELAMLLQSLRTQTFQEFDIFIMDCPESQQLQTHHFMNCILNVIKQEDHKVFIKIMEFTEGVAQARQKIVDWANEFDYEFYCRLDDDCFLEPDYLERLHKVLGKGYDLASGITAPCTPSLKRDPKFLNGIANRVILDSEGNYIFNGDDCGVEYTESVILPIHHFRSCALYKSEIHKKANYLPTPLSYHGFREEQIFSYRIVMAGYKMAIDTQAKNYHQMTPSGGERHTQTNENTMFNQKQLEQFTRDNVSELRKYFPDEPKMSELALSKSTNLLMR